MASDSQWSGLLIVVIFVAIFAITSVVAMAIYFFCKCHKKKQKQMQIRPAQNRNNNESDDDETGNLFLRRIPREDGLHWITTSDSYDEGRSIYQSPRRLDTPNASGISETYMPQKKKRRERRPDYQTIQERRDVEEQETYLSEAIESVRKANGKNLASRRQQSEREAYLNMIASRRSVDSTNTRTALVSVQEDVEENYENSRGDHISPRRIYVEKTGKKRTPRSKTQVTSIADNYDTAQILRIEPESDLDNVGGIYIKPQRVKVRDSTSRESGTRSMSPSQGRRDYHEVPQGSFSSRSKSKGKDGGRGHQGDSSFMFTASSKMAWMLDS